MAVDRPWSLKVPVREESVNICDLVRLLTSIWIAWQLSGRFVDPYIYIYICRDLLVTVGQTINSFLSLAEHPSCFLGWRWHRYGVSRRWTEIRRNRSVKIYIELLTRTEALWGSSKPSQPIWPLRSIPWHICSIGGDRSIVHICVCSGMMNQLR